MIAKVNLKHSKSFGLMNVCWGSKLYMCMHALTPKIFIFFFYIPFGYFTFYICYIFVSLS